MSFTVKGVRLSVSFYFAAVLALMLSLRAPGEVLLALFSSILHECGHLAAMIACKNEIKAVRLEITGMNIIRNESDFLSFRQEIFIALSGPLTNAGIFLLCGVLYWIFQKNIFLTAACINLLLAVFNLLPVKRLDGSMALYFLLSLRFSQAFCRAALKISSVMVLAPVYLWGIYVFLAGNKNFTVIIIAVFLTLSMLGGNDY